MDNEYEQFFARYPEFVQEIEKQNEAKIAERTRVIQSATNALPSKELLSLQEAWLDRGVLFTKNTPFQEQLRGVLTYARSMLSREPGDDIFPTQKETVYALTKLLQYAEGYIDDVMYSLHHAQMIREWQPEIVMSRVYSPLELLLQKNT